MRDEITNPVGTWWIVANDNGNRWVVDGAMPTKSSGGGWYGNGNSHVWTPAENDVFADCILPKVTFEGGPIQFEIDKDLNTTWYKE